MGTVTETFVEQLDELLQQQGERQLAWGNPLLSTTPTSVAIRDLAMRVEALEEAVREIALEVQRRTGDA